MAEKGVGFLAEAAKAEGAVQTARYEFVRCSVVPFVPLFISHHSVFSFVRSVKFLLNFRSFVSMISFFRSMILFGVRLFQFHNFIRRLMSSLDRF